MTRFKKSKGDLCRFMTALLPSAVTQRPCDLIEPQPEISIIPVSASAQSNTVLHLKHGYLQGGCRSIDAFNAPLGQ